MAKQFMPRIEGMTPDRLGEVPDIGNELRTRAVIFTGMALPSHDALLDANIDLRTRYPKPELYQTEALKVLEGEGWDVPAFSQQRPTEPIWPVQADRRTSVDLFGPRRGISWHRDSQDLPGGRRALPFGWAVSVNLADAGARPTYFDVSNPPEGAIVLDNPDDIDDIHAYDLSNAVAPGEHFLRAELQPGDVVAWQQPSHHRVITPKITRHPRRSIVVGVEDVADRKQLPPSFRY